jgi:hypothetical protein
MVVPRRRSPASASAESLKREMGPFALVVVVALGFAVDLWSSPPRTG